MSELAAQQAALAELLRREASVVEDGGAVALAAGSARLSPGAQVEIYREQYFLRHLDVLREDFGALARLLGSDAFEDLGRAYLRAHAPRSFTLRDLGHAMPRFVAETAPWHADPRLGDLAAVEWAFVEAFDAPSLPALQAAALTAVAPEAWPSVRMVLQPHVKRLSLASPAHDYRQAVRRGETPAALPLRPSFVAVFRGPDALHCLELDLAAHTLLAQLAAGTALGEACEIAAHMSGEPPSRFEADLGSWFQQWTALGFLSSLRPDA
ncbi:hypothetical protein BH11MYX4_BH11MYX4_00640 [soil metagenome]